MSGKAPLYAGRWDKGWRKEVQGAWADGAIAHIYCKLAHRFSLVSASPKGGHQDLLKTSKIRY